MGGGDPANGGRVTTKQFYEAQLATNKAIADNSEAQSEERVLMERRLMAELKGLPTRIEKNEDEIEKLRKNSNVKDWLIGIVAAVGTAISIVIGANK